jgi:hypothetical protein
MPRPYNRRLSSLLWRPYTEFNLLGTGVAKLAMHSARIM